MHDALVGLLDKVDTAVAESAGVLDQSDVEAMAGRARDIRLRLSFPESIVVAALAGGTGSGKSSLLNAVAGEEIALTGGIRPMTSAPLALVPASGAQALDGYLDALAISERVEHNGPTWLCLIDLPDNDSVEVDHRHQVDALLPKVDMIVWVTDPEKYRDASLHRGYISTLSSHHDQFLFVLNQIDRLDEEDARAIADDLEQALREDGIAEPEIIPTAAHPVAGPPMGIDSLVQSLERAKDRRDTVHRKLLTDLVMAASRLVESSSGAQSVEFEERWEPEVVAAVDLAMDGKAAGGGHDLATFVAGLAREVGGETGERLGEIALETHSAFVRCAAEADLRFHPAEHGPRSWPARLRGRGRRDWGPSDEAGARQRLAAEVNETIGDRIRELLARRGRAHAAIADLVLSLGDLERRTA